MSTIFATVGVCILCATMVGAVQRTISEADVVCFTALGWIFCFSAILVSAKTCTGTGTTCRGCAGKEDEDERMDEELEALLHGMTISQFHDFQKRVAKLHSVPRWRQQRRSRIDWPKRPVEDIWKEEMGDG